MQLILPCHRSGLFRLNREHRETVRRPSVRIYREKLALYAGHFSETEEISSSICSHVHLVRVTVRQPLFFDELHVMFHRPGVDVRAADIRERQRQNRNTLHCSNTSDYAVIRIRALQLLISY